MTTKITVHRAGRQLRGAVSADESGSTGWLTATFWAPGGDAFARSEVVVFLPPAVARRLADVINREIEAIEAEARAATDFLAAAEREAANG